MPSAGSAGCTATRSRRSIRRTRRQVFAVRCRGLPRMGTGMRVRHVWVRTLVASVALSLVLAIAAPAAAQQVAGQRLDIGIQFVTSHSGEFDANDAGVGARFSLRVTPLVGVEAELTAFPNDF